MDACMGMNLSRWDVAFAWKNAMKNKVCGPEGCLHKSEAGSTRHGMKIRFDGTWHKLRPWDKHLIPGPFGPTNLIFRTIFSITCHVPSTQLRSHASTLRPINLISHTTSRRPNFALMQAPFGPTNLIFHRIFSSECHIPSAQVHSHTSVHWTLIIPSIVLSLFDLISSTGPNLSHYVHLVVLMPHSLNSIHTSLMNYPHLVPFHRSGSIHPSELCIAYVILSDRSYFMQLIR